MTQGKHEAVVLNGIEVDKSIAPLIQKLWGAGVRTYQSCGGDCEEKAYLIIHKDDLQKALPFLPASFEVEKGTGGYCLEDYCEDPPCGEDVLFVSFEGRENSKVKKQKQRIRTSAKSRRKIRGRRGEREYSKILTGLEVRQY